MGKSKPDKDTIGSGVDGDAQLLEDVKAFAAQLGFGSAGGPGEGALFEDFAPDVATKKTRVKANEDNKEDEHTLQKQRKNPARAGKPKKVQKRTSDAPTWPSQEAAAAPKTGRGPVRSLLRKDDVGMWWELTTSPPKPRPGGKPLDASAIENLRLRGEELLQAEASAFEIASSRDRGSSVQWLQQAQRGGTTSDKVAAMAVLVQESPIANLRALDGLVGMAGKRGGARAIVGTALDALKELWMDVLLPADRKLRFFEQQEALLRGMPAAHDAAHGKDADRGLLLWSFEHAVKHR